MKYILEEALVHYSDKKKLDYDYTVESIYTEYSTLEELRKNIILEDDTEYFIYYVDDKYKLNDDSLDFDENEENGFDDNYFNDRCIGGLACNNFCYDINSKAKELENEINDIIRNYEYEHENNYNNYNADELKKLLNDFFENNKKIKVGNVELCIDDIDIDINSDTEPSIFRSTNSNSISISLNCDRYVQQYLDSEINNWEKIIEEIYLQDHEIGGIVINRTLHSINEKLEEIENDINNIIKDYEDEHESNYDKKDLEENLKKYLANIKYIKVDSYKLELNNDIMNCIVDESINETFHYMLCANDLFNEYVNCELDSCREIIKERFSQENTQTDDFEL